VASQGGALTACPNPTGLRAFSRAAKEEANRIALSYGHVSLSADLAHADPSWWDDVRSEWVSSSPAAGKRATVLASAPAARNAYGTIVRRSCGLRLIHRSWTVVAGPPQKGSGPHCNACNGTFFLVNRLGHPLVYFVN
jgi:hypothetical protein